MAQIIVLLPTRNEEEGLAEVIGRIPQKEISSRGFETKILVVDGKSEDSTCQIALEQGAELIQQRGPLGKGIGFKEAIEHIFQDKIGEGDLLVMLDADATYHPEDIPRFIDALEHNEVVWGSRMRGNVESGAMTRVNRLGNNLLSLVASLVNLKKTTDLCTGYWGFRLTILNKITLTARGFSLEADLFGSVCKGGYRTEELVIDYDHREGQSNLKWYKDGPRIFLMIIGKRLRKR